MVSKYLKLVRFSHTIFALPFALAGFVLAVEEYGFSWEKLLWVIVAMVTARSAAMGFNRILDRKIDALNPRTKNREIPAGKITVPQATVFVILSSGLFVLSAFMLNMLCGILSPVALAIVFFYSFTKRFTWTSQFFLGLSLAVAPTGAWLAVSGVFDVRIVVLSATVLAWVAGFDVFYSCLDLEFDKKQGLLSVPVRWGINKGIWIARFLHLLTAALLLSLYWLFAFNYLYLVITGIVIAILAVEDFLVRPNDLSKAMLAFNLNGTISILFLVAVAAGLWVRF